MKSIVIKDDFGFIYLNSSFYSKQLILNTLEIYKDFIKSSLSTIGKYNIIKLELITKDYTLEIISNEILNYILSLEFEQKK